MISSVATDPTWSLTTAWIDAVLPRLSDLTEVSISHHGAIQVLSCEIPGESVEMVAWRSAVTLAARRLGGVPLKFFQWLAKLSWDEPLDATVAARIQVPLLVNVGTPDAPGTESHLLGLVAECLWFDLTRELDVGVGRPVVLEGHQWSAIDPGGDGLAIYAVEDTFSFTLWESKAHGSFDPVRDSVNEACRQLNLRGLEYLGRFSPVAQRITDDPVLAAFICELPERWADADPSVGVGVSVSATPSAPSADCFDGIPGYFSFGTDREDGRLNLVGDLHDFADLMRHFLWKGCV